MDMKLCTRCKDTKPVGEFSFRDKAAGRLQSRCKPCCSEVFKVYHSANRDKFREYRREYHIENREVLQEKRRARKAAQPAREFTRKRRSYIKKQFEMTLDDYDAMLVAQGHACAICRTQDPGRGYAHFNVDHCHTTGKIRGLLCVRCNFGVGYFQDDAARLRAAAVYLGGVV